MQKPITLYRKFSIFFISIWLIYDLLDIFYHGTAFSLNPFSPKNRFVQLQQLQFFMVLTEIFFLLGFQKIWIRTLATWLMLIARGLIVFHFLMLNDFLFFLVVVLLFAIVETCDLLWRDSENAEAWFWKIFRLQIAWIYLATGLLKLNEHWLSGRHLQGRLFQLTEVHGWHYLKILNSISPLLATIAICVELTLSFLLFSARFRKLTFALCLGLHLFAMVLNVWVFGFLMIASVWLLTQPLADNKNGQHATGNPF